MFRATILVMSIAMASAAQRVDPRAFTLRELTVRAERLPPGCVLSPAESVRVDGTRVRVRNWAGLHIPTNPWAGTDAPLIASIRERVDGPAFMPDGPPLTARQGARYRLHLAEGLEEAYAAIYTQSEPAEYEPGRELIIVYGLRFATAQRAVDRRSDTSKSPRIIRVVIGPVVAVVHGNGGPCFEAVGAHLKSLAN